MRKFLAMFVAALAMTACSESQQSAPEKKEKPTLPPLSEQKPLDSITENAVYLQQVTRETIEETFVLPPSVGLVKTFVQSADTVPMVDILVIVDDSGSMEKEQKNLANKVQPLLSAIVDANWQIQVISTQTPCPQFPYLPLTARNPNYAENFFDAVDMGVSQGTNASSEKAMFTAALNLTGFGKCPTPLKQWRRPGAALALLILSDEDESVKVDEAEAERMIEFQNGVNPLRDKGDEKFHVTPTGMIDLLKELGYVPGVNAKAYGLVGHPKRVAECGSDARPAPLYAELIERTNGVWGMICSDDYSEALEAISIDVRNLLKTVIPLDGEPASRSDVQPSLDGEAFKGLWKVEESSFILESPIPADAELRIDYEIKEPSYLFLQRAAVPESLNVAIEGEALNPSGYGYDPELRRLRLAEASKEERQKSRKVAVRYRLNVELKRSFPFPKVGPQRIICLLNGQPIAQRYLSDDSVVVFTEAPPDGARIKCIYEAL